jgi:pantetheine-phosphate adenylyltransferase
MITAVYPGSFDPVTNGHIDIIKRSSNIFDRLIVGVGCNYSKSPFFTVEERAGMINDVLLDLGLLENIEIETFDGLLMDYVKSKGAKVIIRGVRALTDFEYENALAQMNKHLEPSVETILLMASEQYSFVSSAMIKEVAKLGGNVSMKVHPIVNQMLKEKFGS